MLQFIVAAINICYLIDGTEDKRSIPYRIEEKLELARNISRCLVSKGDDTKIATVTYDSNAAKLGFNFKRIEEILSDGFQQILDQRQRRNTQGMLYFINYSSLSFLAIILRSSLPIHLSFVSFLRSSFFSIFFLPFFFYFFLLITHFCFPPSHLSFISPVLTFFPLFFSLYFFLITHFCLLSHLSFVSFLRSSFFSIFFLPFFFYFFLLITHFCFLSSHLSFISPVLTFFPLFFSLYFFLITHFCLLPSHLFILFSISLLSFLHFSFSYIHSFFLTSLCLLTHNLFICLLILCNFQEYSRSKLFNN